MVDLLDERGRVLVPSGSVMRGVVSSVNKATRTDRKGSLTVAFDQVTINGRAHPMRATVTQALESEGIKGEAGKIGIGAGAGAILGAILRRREGALAGILIGGGGTIAATEGKDVELPVGTTLRVRLDSPLTLSAAERAAHKGHRGEQRTQRAEERYERLPLLPLLPLCPLFPFVSLTCFDTSRIAPLAASIVRSTSFTRCAAERNQASNCDGGG